MNRDDQFKVNSSHNENYWDKDPASKETRTVDSSDTRKDGFKQCDTNPSNTRSQDESDGLKKRDCLEGQNNGWGSTGNGFDNKDGQKKKSGVRRGTFDSSEDESPKPEAQNGFGDFNGFGETRNEPSFKKYKSDDNNNNNGQYEIFFGELNFDATEDDVREHFSKCGNINQVKLLARPDGKSRGRGFVKFGDEASMKKALDLHDTEMMGRRIVVEIPSNPSGKRGGGPGNNQNFNNRDPPSGEESSSVVVRNLPFKIHEDEIKELFEDCGSIRGVKVMRNENGDSKGFGFVDFHSVEDARKALNKSGAQLQGRSINVVFSTPKGGNRGSGEGRGGRGRGGFDPKPQMSW